MASKKLAVKPTRESELQAWIDAHPGAFDPEAFVKAARAIDAKHGLPQTPEFDAAYRNFALKNLSTSLNVWGQDREDPTRRTLAAYGDTSQSTPLAPGYQEEYNAALAKMPRGKIDPEAYATMREALDKKYGYAVGPEQHKAYTDWATKYYNSERPINFTVPDPAKPMGDVQGAYNWAVNNPVGAAVTSYANAAGFGVPGMTDPRKLSALTAENPTGSLVGDMLGMGAGAEGLGTLGRQAILRAAPAALRVPGMLGAAAADAAYGAARGKAEGTGAVEGAMEYGLPTLGMHGTGAAFTHAFPTHFNVRPAEGEVLRDLRAAPERNPLLASNLSVDELRRRAGAARVVESALEGSPEYKQAVFDAYGRHMPDVVAQSGAKDYDQLLKSAYGALGQGAPEGSPLAQLAHRSETFGKDTLTGYSPRNADIIDSGLRLQRQLRERQMLEHGIATEPPHMHGVYQQALAAIPPEADLRSQLEALQGQVKFAPETQMLLPPEYINEAAGVPDYLKPLTAPRAPSEARGVHFGPEGLTMTDPSTWGSGASGRAEAPSMKAQGAGGRTYFYVAPEGVPVDPEKVVADRAKAVYHSPLSGLYDVNADPEGLVKLARAHTSNGYESAIPYNLQRGLGATGDLDGRSLLMPMEDLIRGYGYKGLLSDFRNQRAAAVFDPVPLEPGYAKGGLAVRRTA